MAVVVYLTNDDQLGELLEEGSPTGDAATAASPV